MSSKHKSAFDFSSTSKFGHQSSWTTAEEETAVSKSDDPDSTTNDELDDDCLWPSAPPNDYIDKITGYENTSFDVVSVPPPPPSPPFKVIVTSPKISDEDNDSVKESPKNVKKPIPAPTSKLIITPEIEARCSEEQAKIALLSYLTEHCCYGTTAAKNMIIGKLEYLPAYHYELQTFCEKRETAWTYTPLRTGSFSSVECINTGGPPPLPWEIEEVATQDFKDEIRIVQVPNTSSTKSCTRCRGSGNISCRDCSGKGWSRCINCHGDGWMHDSGGYRDRCFYCQHSHHGQGQQDCIKCSSKGTINCSMCSGQGKLRCFIQLSITWKVQTIEHIVDRCNFPQDLIREVSGQVAFEEESAPRVNPVSAFNDEAIKIASTQLVERHLASLNDHRLLKQRHQVRIVPITKVNFQWKGSTYEYFVYGYENKVYAPKYPQKCCCGCTVL